MSVLISNEDYKEYMVLLNTAKFQMKINSVNGTHNLKDDIDVPMRKLVAIFALLKCEPLWSCCGFDYNGQPLHKTHEYGNCYIALRNIERTQQIIQALKDSNIVFDLKGDTSNWETWIQGHVVYLRSDFDYFHKKSEYPWSMTSCIHYSELSLIYINRLEKQLLLQFGNELLNEVTLCDTNKNQKINLKHWQYPILEDWTIKIEDLVLL